MEVTIHEEILYSPTAKNRQSLMEQIRKALRHRQHITINGSSIGIKKLLNDLIYYDRGKAMILPEHEEDHTFHIMQNIGFPSSDKIHCEGVMNQVLQEFGWPTVTKFSNIHFYFGKLLKELYNDDITPVFLFEHPEIMKEKAFRILEIISEYTIGRTCVGIPTILCVGRYLKDGCSLPASFRLELIGELTRNEIYGQIEEVAPGTSQLFDEYVLDWLIEIKNLAMLKVKVIELLDFMHKLGLKEVNWELHDEWKKEHKAIREREYAKTQD